MKLFDLTGKSALVTGAARGLGQAMAIGLAEAGADVVMVANQSDPADTKAGIEAAGRRCVIIMADLSDPKQLDEVVRQAAEAFGKLDILLNNAGIIRRAPAADHSAGDWYDVMDLNLNAAFFLCQLAGREMIARGSGKIINIASVLSFQGGITVPGYTASKHGIVGITKAFANEWAAKGVQVNAIAPGYMETDNTLPLRENAERFAQISDRIPAGKWGTPEDLKGAAVFLASSASDYVNGHVLCVDGGWMVR